MKLSLILAVFLFASPAFSAERACRAKRGYEGHESFCRDLSQFACGIHSSLCRAVVLPDAEGSCLGKRGYEAHDSFCSGLSQFSCDIHSSLCRWFEGWDEE